MIHYLAIPPQAFRRITEGIGEHGLADHARVVYEKPFGTSMAQFEELNELAHSVFAEDAVYRIDHFLGKEAAQDIDVMRSANGLIDAAWDRHSVESVQIDIPETLDVGTRAQFYDGTGAFLDMIVTHLFQLAAQVAKEPTGSDREAAAAARERVIAAFRPLSPDEVVLGQYDGYLKADGIDPDSRTDTFVAARLWIDNDRWRGVPFLLRTGKAMAESHQRVSIVFRRPDGAAQTTLPSVLAFELSGQGSVSLSLTGKRPGAGEELEQTTVQIPLTDFGGKPLPAYSRLVHDVLRGRRAQFTTPEGLAHVWTAAGPVLADPPTVQSYAYGSWGPEAAAELAGADGWLTGQ